MELSPEERKRIYEEEKAKIEAQDKKEHKEEHKEEKKTTGGSTLGLKPNVAGLLCYIGFWVTGIIFLCIERKNRLIRYHAMQALVTFGILNIIWGIANTFGGPLAWSYWGFFSPIQIAGLAVFIIFFVIWWVLWGILLYKTYHGQPYRVPFFSGIADRCLAKLDDIK